MLHIYVDADACPVKNEVYKVASRYNLDVTLVSNSWMRIPKVQRIVLKVVNDDLDAADDWIVQEVKSEDIVVTADIQAKVLFKVLDLGAITTVKKPPTKETVKEAIDKALEQKQNQ